MKLPTLKRPVSRLTDAQILRAMDRITDYFADYASSDSFGWDWPTMRQVFPSLCEDYKNLKAEAIRRLETTGKFDGIAYTRQGSKWVANPT